MLKCNTSLDITHLQDTSLLPENTFSSTTAICKWVEEAKGTLAVSTEALRRMLR